MNGHRIGYVRVSSADQNTQRQIEAIGSVDKVFSDHVSGKTKNRPELNKCLEYVREGDTLVVHSMDRLARNLDDLRSIVNRQNAKGVRIEFIKEGLTFTGEDSPMSTLLLNVMGAFAEFERELIRERQREGIEIAKKKGVYRGRKQSLTQEQIQEIKDKVALGIPKAKIARDLKISRQTLYDYIDKGAK